MNPVVFDQTPPRWLDQRGPNLQVVIEKRAFERWPAKKKLIEPSSVCPIKDIVLPVCWWQPHTRHTAREKDFMKGIFVALKWNGTELFIATSSCV